LASPGHKGRKELKEIRGIPGDRGLKVYPASVL